MTTGMNHGSIFLDDLTSAIPSEWIGFNMNMTVNDNDNTESCAKGHDCGFSESRDSSESTTGYFTYDGEDDHFEEYLDLNAMPATREPSLEPLWRSNNCYAMDQEHRSPYEQIQARSSAIRKSSREPPLQHFDASIPAQPNQTVHLNSQLVLDPHQNTNAMFHGGVRLSFCASMPTPSVDNVPSGMPTLKNQPSLPQPDRRPSMPYPERKPAPAPKQENYGGVPQAKGSVEAKAREQVKGESVFDNLSVDQKEALCKYIYDFMIEKELTKPEGYLVVDILCEIWQDMRASPESWRLAQGRFGDLLSFAPQYFRVFRKSIRVASSSGWFSRKGQKMVQLVL